MNTETALHPDPDDALSELVAIGLRGARVLVRLMEVEQMTVDAMAVDLPRPGVEPESASAAHAAGVCLDGMAEWLTRAVPRAEALARALDRVSRSVRRSVALLKRMRAGWPRAGRADDQPAMVRRQVTRGVAEVIGRVSESDDTAERLFDDLAERLEEPGFEQEMHDLPVAEVVRRICRDLGLAAQDLRPFGGEATQVADELSAKSIPGATHGPPPG